MKDKALAVFIVIEYILFIYLMWQLMTALDIGVHP